MRHMKLVLPYVFPGNAAGDVSGSWRTPGKVYRHDLRRCTRPLLAARPARPLGEENVVVK